MNIVDAAAQDSPLRATPAAPSHSRAKKKPIKVERRGPGGTSGLSGATGPVGPAGPAGADHAPEIALLAAQVAELFKGLQKQLMRIAQIQAELDRLASARASARHNRRSTDRDET